MMGTTPAPLSVVAVGEAPSVSARSESPGRETDPTADVRHVWGLLFCLLGFGTYLARENWGSSLDDVYTISPTTVLDVRLSWTRFVEGNSSPRHTTSEPCPRRDAERDAFG